MLTLSHHFSNSRGTLWREWSDWRIKEKQIQRWLNRGYHSLCFRVWQTKGCRFLGPWGIQLVGWWQSVTATFCVEIEVFYYTWRARKQPRLGVATKMGKPWRNQQLRLEKTEQRSEYGRCMVDDPLFCLWGEYLFPLCSGGNWGTLKLRPSGAYVFKPYCESTLLFLFLLFRAEA